jgi:hypothetical protein
VPRVHVGRRCLNSRSVNKQLRFHECGSIPTDSSSNNGQADP